MKCKFLILVSILGLSSTANAGFFDSKKNVALSSAVVKMP